MRIIGVIPARYSSTRLPGKPLADICGKPMLWWVYQAIKKIDAFDDVFCAIDDKRIENMCKKEGIKYIITSNLHPNHISRIHEVSEKIAADFYVCINGDEPLISSECILPVIKEIEQKDSPVFYGAMRKLTKPSEVVDFSKIKLVVSEKTGRCLYMSRGIVPYPRGSLDFSYKKYIGVECFNKKALDFFVSTPMGDLEKIEDIDHLRFLENGISLFFKYVNSESISVDTEKDLEYVRNVIKNMSLKGCD